MGKYTPLKDFLESVDKREVRLRFSEIESIIGTPLPQSAYNHSAWWANGGHSHADAWLNAGFKVEVDYKTQRVHFCKVDGIHTKPVKTKTAVPRPQPTKYTLHRSLISGKKTLCVLGYEFQFIQQIQPQRGDDGEILKFYPQSAYDNKANLSLLDDGDGAFCKFTIEAGNLSGVYLWVVNNEIIYIGETENLHNRFNNGYGQISPRNCFAGGRSTNCRMNKVVLEHSEDGNFIDLYFFETQNYKQVELELLRVIDTPYNKKNNWRIK